MIESYFVMPPRKLPKLAALPGETSQMHGHVVSKRKTRNGTLLQFVRFGLVGCLNTAIDLLVLNALLWLWPGWDTVRLVLFNTIAYACGALNSFALNRYWTFRREEAPNVREGARFLLVTLVAISCNDLFLWLMGKILKSAHLNVALWANGSKVVAIGGTMLVSYLGMRLWVFVQSSQQNRGRFVRPGTRRHPGGKRS